MKTYTATIMAQTVVPTTAAPIVLDVEAAHPLEAARSVAERIATAHYGEKGIAPHVAAQGNVFLAHVGEFQLREGWGVTKGVTLRITLEETKQ